MRGKTGLRTPDAIQLAAAHLTGADAILTNDRRCVGRVARPRVVVLDEYVGLAEIDPKGMELFGSHLEQ